MNDILSITGNIFTALDHHFAELVSRLSGDRSPELLIAAMLTSNQISNGNICVDIPSIAGKFLDDVLGGQTGLKLPPAKSWISSLRKNRAIGRPGDFNPLILDDAGRLYLYRYWQYEKRLAGMVRSRVVENFMDIDVALLADGLGRFFPASEQRGTDWQKIAAITAVFKKFCIISGGPGTGKTYTVAKILALCIEQALKKYRRLEIALTAPTGKAAARLKSAIRDALENLNVSNAVKELIPEETFTIHRLLRTVPGSPYFRYNLENPLPFDIVVVDESSMADLALLTKLSLSVPEGSRLIFLGDKDQLASVEAGAVLGDICDTGREHCYSANFIENVRKITGEILINDKKAAPATPVADSIIILRKSYRFGADTGIGEFSRAVRDGDAEAAISILNDKRYKDISLVSKGREQNFAKAISQRAALGYSDFLKAKTPGPAFDYFNRFKILCALRYGPYGSVNVNDVIMQALKERRIVDPGERWYSGQPIIVNRNDYNLKLYNGDTGIILPDLESDGSYRAYFQSAEGPLRKILPVKLPEHENVYAMTVHKSQGSEYDHIVIILPDKPVPVLTKELLYTAVTRARGSVEIWAGVDVLAWTIRNPIKRVSGLRDELWGQALTPA